MIAPKGIKAAFGKALRQNREAVGFSQEELAERSGIHRTYVGDVERGERNLGLVNMHRLAKALGVPLARIVRDMQRYLKP